MQTFAGSRDPFDPADEGRYSAGMRTVALRGAYRFGLVWAVAWVLAGEARAAQGDPSFHPPPDFGELSRAVPLREYRLFDLIVDGKFLSSQTELVLIERMTTTRLRPDWPPVSAASFEESGFFEGRLRPGWSRISC